MKTIENESKTNQIESLPASVPVPVTPSATVPVEPSSTLNLKLNNLNKINLNNLINLNCKAETEKRIGSRLRGAGFFISNKMLDKILATIPDPAWLLPGYDFPTWLASFIKSKYPGKPETEKLKLFYSAALPKEGKWEEVWEAYPNWLNGMIGNIIAKEQAAKLSIPPTDYCPDCGEEHKLARMKCPKCAGWYAPDEKNEKLVWHKQLSLVGIDCQKMLTEIANAKRWEAQNAKTV